MNDLLNDDNMVKLTDYCDIKQISYKEAINNILAEYFLERERRLDDENNI